MRHKGNAGCNPTWFGFEGDGERVKRLIVGLRGQHGAVRGVGLQAR